MAKPKLFYFDDHIMFLTEQAPAESHRHLASHLVISLDDNMEWFVGGEKICCRGLYIDSNVEHMGKGKGRFLTFLFLKTSGYACSAEENLLKGRSYAVLNEDVVNKIIEFTEKLFSGLYPNDNSFLNKKILELCGFSQCGEWKYDTRIRNAISAIENAETIDSTTIDKLSDCACLSKSRFLHLFKEQTKMSLAGYLAFEKLRKTYHYILKGNNITESCMKAGFDTPSHCAAACQKMFGISLKKIAFI